MTQQVIVRQGASAVEIKRNTGPIRVFGKTPAGAGSLLAANNLSDLGNTATAQQNLGVREVLTADRTYYVRTDGSDSNDGLTDSSGGAFLTIGKAEEEAAKIDANGFDVTIKLGTGTWASHTFSAAPIGVGAFTLLGDTTTPSNVVTGSITVSGTKLLVGGVQTSGGSHGIRVRAGGEARISGNMEFGSASRAHIWVQDNCSFYADADYSIVGDAARHVEGVFMAYVNTFNRTVTLVGSRNFSTAFVQLYRFAVAGMHTMTFTGTATGKRYISDDNSMLYTAGAGATYLPGDVAGTTATGGLYV